MTFLKLRAASALLPPRNHHITMHTHAQSIHLPTSQLI